MIAAKSYPYWFKFYRIIHLGEYKDDSVLVDFFNLTDDFLRSATQLEALLSAESWRAKLGEGWWLKPLTPLTTAAP